MRIPWIAQLTGLRIIRPQLLRMSPPVPAAGGEKKPEEKQTPIVRKKKTQQ